VPLRPLSQAAHALLAVHGWRGNVRELENTVHRAVLLATGDEIGAEAIELAPGIGGPAHSGQSASVQSAPAQQAPGVSGLVGRTMDEVERGLILETLSHTLGNRTHAATILGISIRALRNKLRDYAQAGAAVTPPGALA